MEFLGWNLIFDVWFYRLGLNRLQALRSYLLDFAVEARKMIPEVL